MFEKLDSHGAQSCTLFNFSQAGLHAVLVIDSTVLGPAAGGIRTWSYPDEAAAVDDALALARAMTLKCALAELDAGGAKMVVLDEPELDRPRAFAWLGARVEELGGTFRTAGDLGTTLADLEAMSRATRFVHTDEGNLSRAVGETVIRCMEACAQARGRASLDGLAIAVQGCGSIGSAVARGLAGKGAKLVVADMDERRSDALAAELGATAVSPSDVLTSDVDIIAPCAKGGVLDTELASSLSAWAVCGGANNILAGVEVEDVLIERDILFVPDVLSSSGAVIAGVAQSVMGLGDFEPLLRRVGNKAALILQTAHQRRERASVVAREVAMARIDAVRAQGSKTS